MSPSAVIILSFKLEVRYDTHNWSCDNDNGRLSELHTSLLLHHTILILYTNLELPSWCTASVRSRPQSPPSHEGKRSGGRRVWAGNETSTVSIAILINKSPQVNNYTAVT